MAPHTMSEGRNFLASISTLDGALCAYNLGSADFANFKTSGCEGGFAGMEEGYGQLIVLVIREHPDGWDHPWPILREIDREWACRHSQTRYETSIATSGLRVLAECCTRVSLQWNSSSSP